MTSKEMKEDRVKVDLLDYIKTSKDENISIRKEKLTMKNGQVVEAELYSKGKYTLLSYKFTPIEAAFSDKYEVIDYLNENGMKIDKTKFSDESIVLDTNNSYALTVVVYEEI